MLSSLHLSHRTGIAIALVVVGLLTASAAFAVSLGQAGLVLLVLAGGLGAIAILLRPALGAALILALAPLEGFVTFRGQSAVALATLFCAAIFFIHVLVTHRRIVFDRIAGLSAALILWSLITILWSPDPRSSLSAWISFALLGPLYFLLINLVQSKEDFKLALWGCVVGGLALSVIGINVMLSTDFARSEWVIGFGINLVSRLIGLNLLLSVLLYQLETHRLGKVVLLVSVVLAGIGAVITLSRGTWLGVSASLAAVVLVPVFRGRFRLHIGRFILWLLVGVVLLFLLSSYVLNQHGLAKLEDRFQSGVTLSDSAGHRFDIWRVGWQAFSDSPIWGHGYDTFRYEFDRYNTLGGEIKGPHNGFVSAGIELGVIGLTIFIAILVAVFMKAWRFMSDDSANAAGVAPWAIALFVFLLIAANVDSAVDRRYLWYVLSLIILLIRFWGQNQSEKIGVLEREN